ncbi:membrane cofactor protein-like [Eptesicus fuscus]|uniref:membrane cofactor protein-like n=1 Tax=Eptesicus fuscus TaxID=29078 RepID=UPI0024046D48|nr:membrane cofactor protein-like [Eptesicus fuscus]XP_054567801.1 membrane cofactor protein-like [Eptesicus fuscus]
MSRTMTASSRRLESPFSWGFLGVLLLALELLLPMCSDACDDLPAFQSMKPKGESEPPYHPGSTVEYECRPGYKHHFPDLPTSVCQPDGTWAPALQEACRKKSCTQLEELLNGEIIYVNGSQEFGSQAHYVCTEGYYLLGTKILHCELSGNDVEWSDAPPSCEKVWCKPPKQIPNGRFTNNQKDKFEYNEEVIYNCNPSKGPDDYTLVGESRLVCSGLNQWSPDPPECKVVKCEYPALENGRLVSPRRKFEYKSEVTFECKEGFHLEGSSTIFCEANSTWEPEIPKCTEEDSLPVMKHQLELLT